MSDAAQVAREWLHERSLSLERTEDLAAMLEAYEQEQTAALRAAYRDVIVAAQCVHDHAPAGTVGLAALCAALGAAPEAAR